MKVAGLEINVESLPNGWTAEPMYGDYILISKPFPGGMVTIDMKTRCAHAGCCYSGATISDREYVGRSWFKRLIADAIAWLQAVA